MPLASRDRPVTITRPSAKAHAVSVVRLFRVGPAMALLDEHMLNAVGAGVGAGVGSFVGEVVGSLVGEVVGSLVDDVVV